MREPSLYWEDFTPGDVLEHRRGPVRKEEIRAFAREYDPQPFHLDEAAAQASLVGGLCASGWHTCSLMMRMMCDAYMLDSASMGAPGVEEARWSKPLFAGDSLTVRRTVLETRASNSRPEMGLTRMRWEAFNQHDEPVASLTFWGMFRRRHPGRTA